MTYPWNDIADRAFNSTYGCSARDCSIRAACWARNMFNRFKMGERIFGGRSFDKPFEVPAAWNNFSGKPGQRIALGWMGDLFDPGRNDAAIRVHLGHAAREWRTNMDCTGAFLIQTRHVARAAQWCYEILRCGAFEIGTSFTSAADVPNIRALAALPKGVVRFIAFEPCDCLLIEHMGLIRAAAPNWAYIGPQRGRKPNMLGIAALGEFLRECGAKVIYKTSCGPELAALNEGVKLP